MLINAQNEENINEAQRKNLLYDLQTICIGCNKEWMDSAFGAPVFTSVDGTTKEEVYIVDIALIRAFFGIEDDACKMFFITQTTEEPIPFMSTINNSYYNEYGEQKKLGTISYNEIDYGTIIIDVAYGFFTNGSGRTFYGEGYGSYGGYYNNIYFASLDYGINTPWNMMGYILSSSISEEEMAYYSNMGNNKLNRYQCFLSNRDKFFPNTYGVSSLDEEYSFDKLMDYNTFDSIQKAYR